MANIARTALEQTLQCYIDSGVDEMIGDQPVNRMKRVEDSSTGVSDGRGFSDGGQAVIERSRGEPALSSESAATSASSSLSGPSSSSSLGAERALLGASDARDKAIELACAANTLEELQDAIASFDGLAVKKTATNMVFCDGNPSARVMVVGEAPGADEDRQGKPFVGVSGQLLDRILACIGLSRDADDPESSFYISNILNWRPPGNRTPSPAEVEVSLPFIEKHIMLAKPEVLVFCGGVSAKGLLARQDSVGKMRKTWHDYTPLTKELGYDGPPVPAIVTYHPAYLLRTPAQKKAVWADMLMVREKLS